MRNNVSKQVLLSVIGVAILVIAVIGVSFALYIDLNYNPGTIELQFKDDKKYIEITNSMPVSMEEGRYSNNEVSFTINGTVNGYAVRVLTDDSSTLKPSEVFAYISSNVISPCHKHILSVFFIRVFLYLLFKAKIYLEFIIPCFFNSLSKYSFSTFKYSAAIGFGDLIFTRALYNFFLSSNSPQKYSLALLSSFNK